MPRRDFSKVAFAATGDTNSIPTPTQPDGSVSLQQGFTFDYQRDNGAGGGTPDPLAKNIDREDMNGIFNEISASVGEMQQLGRPIWVTTAAPYPIKALVRHNDLNWTSEVANNSAEPGTNSNWSRSDVQSGTLLRRTVYSRVSPGGAQQVSVDGAVPTTVGASTFIPHPLGRFAIADVQGAGSAGGGTTATSSVQISIGQGGMSGARAKAFIARATFGASVAVTVGVGGVGVVGANGAAGGSSSVGSLVASPGGLPGALGGAITNTVSTFNLPPAGGAVPTGGNLLSTPAVPGCAALYFTNAGGFSGSGGNSPITGGGGAASVILNTSGQNATSEGAGGGGAANSSSSAARAGGRGGDGLVIIEEWA